MHLLLERLQASVSLDFLAFFFFFFVFLFSSPSSELDDPSVDADGSGDEEDKISCPVDWLGPVKMGMSVDISKQNPRI